MNEIVSSNQSSYYDEDGETPDWIELYNPTASNISLNGWGLSDDLEDLYKWQIPNVVLEPESFLLIMPDTFFVGQKPYNQLDSNTDFCNLACWEIRDSQRGKLGEVKINQENSVVDMVDKKPDNGYKYSWGALTFNKKLVKYINADEPHIGYAVKNGIDAGEKVFASVVDGKYYDCGTPSEYVELLEETLLK